MVGGRLQDPLRRSTELNQSFRPAPDFGARWHDFIKLMHDVGDRVLRRLVNFPGRRIAHDVRQQESSLILFGQGNGVRSGGLRLPSEVGRVKNAMKMSAAVTAVSDKRAGGQNRNARPTKDFFGNRTQQ